MYYPDMTPYSYSRDDVAALPGNYADPNHVRKVLNVGWLEPPYPFPVAPASDEFLDALFALCEHRCNQMRGFHVCPYCDDLPSAELRIPRREITVRLAKHMQASRHGKTIWIGSAEIRVRGRDGTLYAAPNMVYHYVAVHDYSPPAAFVEAVLTPQPNQPG